MANITDWIILISVDHVPVCSSQGIILADYMGGTYFEIRVTIHSHIPSISRG